MSVSYRKALSNALRGLASAAILPAVILAIATALQLTQGYRPIALWPGLAFLDKDFYSLLSSLTRNEETFVLTIFTWLDLTIWTAIVMAFAWNRRFDVSWRAVSEKQRDCIVATIGTDDIWEIEKVRDGLKGQLRSKDVAVQWRGPLIAIGSLVNDITSEKPRNTLKVSAWDFIVIPIVVLFVILITGEFAYMIYMLIALATVVLLVPLIIIGRIADYFSSKIAIMLSIVATLIYLTIVVFVLGFSSELSPLTKLIGYFVFWAALIILLASSFIASNESMGLGDFRNATEVAVEEGLIAFLSNLQSSFRVK